MENLISLVHKIERAYTALADQGQESALPTDWDALPSIAVVGGQSSGKSSVLESVVGKDFLPRGSGIVTRRPLVLQLHRIDGTREYAQFSHQPGKTYRSFAEVRKEIADETDRETRLSKPISSVPIHLSIFAPDVVNLTLVDLPGLSKIAVDGQSDSIVQEIESMVRAFIEKPDCIILVVSPANQDLTTSDAIKIAREVDPKGERTFGVLTKLDLMPKGTHAVDVLEGKTCRLQFPWTGVVNRSQEDINMSLDIIDARRMERDYFANTPEYKQLAHRMGSQHLVRILAKHLVSVIKSKLPRDYLFKGGCINSEESKKNSLQTYSLRAYGTLPTYKLCMEGEPHNMTFQCSVQVRGQEFWSAKGHAHSKHAEEEAACVAYTALMGNESMDTLFQLIEKGSTCRVMLLKEYTLKKGLGDPVYGSSRVAAESQLTLWLSTVSLDARIFIGDAASTKRASVQNAACAAVQSFLEDGDDLMIKMVLSKNLRVKVPRKKSKSNGAAIAKNRSKKRKIIVESLLADSVDSVSS